MIPACSSAMRVRATELDSVPSRVGGHWFRTIVPLLPRRRTASTVFSPAAISRYVGLLTITLRSAAFMAATMSLSGAAGVSMTSNSQPVRLPAFTTAKSFAAAVSINSPEPSNRERKASLADLNGSMSATMVRSPASRPAIARFTATVVFPAPPFRETIAQILIVAPAHHTQVIHRPNCSQRHATPAFAAQPRDHLGGQKHSAT